MITQEKINCKQPEKFFMRKLSVILFILLFLMPLSVCAKKQEDNSYKLAYINIDWWENYKDPILREYMLRIYNDNQDIKIATIKSEQSNQVVKMSLGQELPQIGFNPNISREFASSDVYFGNVIIPNYTQSRFLLPLTMNYEVDIWGKNRQITKSFSKELEMEKQNERASYILVTSAFASDYFNLVKADALLKNQEKLVELQKNIVEATDKKYQSGLCPVSILLEEKQILTNFEEQLNSLKEKQDVLENQLYVYLGDRTNHGIKRTAYEDLYLVTIPESIDSTAIKYRPDLIRTEKYIEKTGLLVKVARKEFLPSFTLYGQVGFNAYQLSKIFTHHTFLSNIGVMPNLDLFTGGTKIARFKYRKLEYQKALQYYEKTVLTSIQELNDSLVSAKTTDKNRKISDERYDIELQKFSLAEKKQNIGASGSIEFMKAQERLLESENSKISGRINYLISTINLYKAVGGLDYNKLEEATL